MEPHGPLGHLFAINRADRHGLSELYQLRGRVGRSNRRAYAYLLVPAEQELTPIARRRLAALTDVLSAARVTRLETRMLLARARGKPQLAYARGE